MIELTLFLCVALVSVYAQDQCSQPLGNTDQIQSTRTDENLFLLDVGHPAECNGTVAELNYCVYRPPPNPGTGSGNPRYQAYVAVFRPGNQTDVYTRVTQFVTLEQRENKINDNFFDCQFSTALDANFEVQEDDVFGVCQITPNGETRLLNVVGIGGPEDSSLHVETTAGTSCINLNISAGGGNLRDSYVLHVYANIITPTVSIPTQSATTTESSDSLTTEMPTNSTPIEPRQTSTNTAAIAASIVVVLLFVTLITVAIAVVAVVLWKRKNVYFVQKRNLSMSLPITAGIDNQIYEDPNVVENAIRNDVYEVPISSSRNDGTEIVAQNYEVPQTLDRDATMMGASKQHYDELDYNHHLTASTVPHVYEYASLSTVVSNEKDSDPQPNDIYYSPLDTSVVVYSELLKQNQERDIYADQSPYYAPATEEDELYAQIKAFGITNISHKEIEVLSHLGSGQFGSVDQGVWRRPNDSAVDVALKTLNEDASEQDKVKFLQEGAIMAQFKHPNIISLYGVVSNKGTIILVTELIQKGDLRGVLVAMQSDPDEILPPETATQMLKFSQQVALGMQYLTSKGFVHRDLAARNILVSSENICKVADFGMSRDLADEQYYVSQGGKIPVKWTAPEALHFKKYSTASDVWSYGCLLYEIWSIGHKPFEEKSNMEVLQLVESGYRLPPPPGCPRRVYELMIAAWHPESSRRPGFRDLLLALMQNKEEILSVPNSHQGSQPGVLGAPLSEAETLYPDLQNMYK